MSIDTAKQWIDLIHQEKDGDLGQRLKALAADAWNNYLEIARTAGFAFSVEELQQAWDDAFGQSAPPAVEEFMTSRREGPSVIDEGTGGGVGKPSPKPTPTPTPTPKPKPDRPPYPNAILGILG